MELSLQTYNDITYTVVPLPQAEGCNVRQVEYEGEQQLIRQLWGEEVQLAHTTTGKPYLQGRPDLYISISHTKGWLAMAWSTKAEVGIDIEYIGQRAAQVSERFIGPVERQLLPCHLPFAKSALAVWCAKEAMFKKAGQENVDFLNDMRCLLYPRSLVVRFKGTLYPFIYRIDNRYCLVVG